MLGATEQRKDRRGVVRLCKTTQRGVLRALGGWFPTAMETVTKISPASPETVESNSVSSQCVY
jgi:hypothetical protein